MKVKHLKRFGSVLESKRAALECELYQELRKRGQIASDQRPGNVVDLVCDSTQREITIYELESKSRLLGNVREALGRIAVGAYGTCVYCGEPIVEERLKAVPWTRTCIGCQERLEQNGSEVFDRSSSYVY